MAERVVGMLRGRFSARLEQSAPVVPAAREQPVQQHPAELGWSAAFVASAAA